ncbi:hypothetical protein AX14_000765 [Amanita brunnescens Koide BX004]|nr:hypothetical protein AX14_000765 [Amanita brunnescens Koide BX004]
MHFPLSIISVAALVSLAGAVTVPGASTPSFYLVASTNATGANLLPLRTTGGANGYATLTGTGPIGVLYFYQGALTAAPGIPALIAAIPLSDCSTYGQLGFAQDDSDKCALYNTFDIQSDTENSQLGAQLTFNYVGGFYACGSGQDVWYQATPSDGPPGLECAPIALWTVPVYG